MKHARTPVARTLSLAALLAGALALAEENQARQAQQPVQPPQAEQPKEQPSQPKVAPAPARPLQAPVYGFAPAPLAMQQGVISGVVANVNYSNGILWLSTDGGRIVALRATPVQMMSLQPGQVVSLPYAVFVGVPWVTTPAALAYGSFSQQGTIAGVVTGLNKASGLVAIHGRAFLAHPQTIQNLLPGQFVSLTYANIGSVPWVQEVAPATEAPFTR